MKLSRTLMYVFGGAFLLLLLIGLFAFLFRGVVKDSDALAVVEVKGTIASGESGGSLFGEVVAGADTLMRQIRQAADDSDVKGLLLYINSPGGSSPASEAVYREVLRFKEKSGKPVVASMSDVAASGGYYIALAADKIIANPATMTGSIGVIMQFANYQGLYEKYGIDIETIKSGKYKDIGNPARDLTVEERELLQTMVNQIYQTFVDAVTLQRGLARDVVLELAQGQIYTGMQAQELQLIDGLGNFYDAVEELAQMTEIKEEPRLAYFKQDSIWDKIFGGLTEMVRAVLGEPKQGIQAPESDLYLLEESLLEPGVNNLRLTY